MIVLAMTDSAARLVALPTGENFLNFVVQPCTVHHYLREYIESIIFTSLSTILIACSLFHIGNKSCYSCSFKAFNIHWRSLNLISNWIMTCRSKYNAFCLIQRFIFWDMLHLQQTRPYREELPREAVICTKTSVLHFLAQHLCSRFIDSDIQKPGCHY